MSLLKTAATFSAKSSAALIKALGLGQASALPGRVALKLKPNILEDFARETQTADFKIVISGTNGKTTTAGLIREIFRQVDSELSSNDLGANLYYGVCASLVANTKLDGSLRSPNYIMETDEAAMQSVTKILKPEIITLTNLFRDQLDRFGELDTTQQLIREGIEACSDGRKLVLNAADPKIVALASSADKVYYYSVDSSVLGDDVLKDCDSQDDFTPPSPDLKLVLKTNDINSFTFDLQVSEDLKAWYPNASWNDFRINIAGLYNLHNAAAAILTALVARVPLEYISSALQSYRPAFGRAEAKEKDGKQYQSFLIKNPTGATEVLKTIRANPNARLLIAINDNYADGRDVSWLWDAEFELIKDHQFKIVCSGKRANDMALRLKYAGIDSKQLLVIPDLQQAFDQALSQTLETQSLYLLPTYTCLLEYESLGL